MWRTLAEMADLVEAVDLPTGQWTDTTFGELTPGQAEAVYQMLVDTYRTIGVPVSSLDELRGPEYKLVMLWAAEPDVPSAFKFYKNTRAGHKFIASGTDGSAEAKRALLAETFSRLQQAGYFAETSERVADIMEARGLRPIDDHERVERILDKPVEWLGAVDWEGHEKPGVSGRYRRSVGNVGPKVKALYGRPNL
jgi:hypothetical protein